MVQKKNPDNTNCSFSASSVLHVTQEDMDKVKDTKPSVLAAVKTAERINALLNFFDRCHRVWKRQEKSNVSACAAVILVSPLVALECLGKIGRNAIGGPVRRILKIKNSCKDEDEEGSNAHDNGHENDEDDHDDFDIDEELAAELHDADMDDGVELDQENEDDPAEGAGADDDHGDIDFDNNPDDEVVVDDNGNLTSNSKSKSRLSNFFNKIKGGSKRK